MDSLIGKVVSEVQQDGCYAPFNFTTVIAVVVVCCVLGLLWSAFNVILVNKIDVEKGIDG